MPNYLAALDPLSHAPRILSISKTPKAYVGRSGNTVISGRTLKRSVEQVSSSIHDAVLVKEAWRRR
jgi:hypothetical protein